MKFTASLPKDDRNGLHMLTGAVLREPSTKHVIVALVDAKEVTTDVDTGAEIPTLRIHAVEGFRRDSAIGKQLRQIWREAWEDRTGNAALPFDSANMHADPDADDD